MVWDLNVLSHGRNSSIWLLNNFDAWDARVVTALILFQEPVLNIINFHIFIY